MEFSFYLYLIPIFAVLILSVFAVNKILKINLVDVKYPEIDGVRGYLAFFVFLHHSYIWHYFLKNKEWKEPSANLFNHFGQTSVAFFFIITAFLFINKLIYNKNREIDWNHYIKSRFYRLFPMYFFSILIVFSLVAYLTDFEIKDTSIENIKSIFSWLFFSVNKTTDINGLKDTFLLNSGVTWTLPYEWMFYFLLPLLSLFFKFKVNYKTLALFLLAFGITLIINGSSLRHFMPFVGGIAVALLLKSNKLGNRLKQKKYTVLSIILLIIAVYFFNSGRKPIPILISSVVFLIIASGNNFFGILSSEFSRKFGQITYSLYLLHGTLLFIVFYFIIGFENAALLSEFEFWSIIILCIFPLFLFSQLTFKYIESPLMNLTKKK